MDDELIFGEVTGDDAQSLVAILRAAFEEYRGRLMPPSGAHRQTQEELQQRLRTAHAVLVSIEGTPVGCVLYEVEPELIYLSRLGVLPAYRRRGIGGALVHHVEG